MKAVSLALPFGTLVVLSGCVAVTNLDRFSRRTPTSTTANDIEFSVTGMTSHVKEYFEARIVSADGITQTLIVCEVLGGEAEQFTIPAGAPIDPSGAPSTYKLEFYADHNHDGVFDLAPDPADHSWIVPLSQFAPDPLDGVVRIPFAHTTNFNTLEVEKKFGANALIHVKNVDALAGKRITLRVADASSKHTVGMYRVPVLAKASFDAQIRGVIDPAEGTRYQLEVTTDDGGAAGDKITGIQGYRDFGSSGNNTGLEISFDPAVTPQAGDVLPAQESPL